MENISICTVCMNRLFHLRETLPASIQQNINYKNLEFVVLDYNSSDGLENWIKSRMMDYVEQGILKYYRTYEPTNFNVCHAKNMVLKLANGNIIGLVDADNYAGKDYASWINNVFTEPQTNAIITTIHKSFIPYRDTGGKLAFRKDLFWKTRGFDESWTGYGFDDVDLVNRLELNGGKRIYIEKTDHLECIEHSHLERICNFYLMKNLEEIYFIKNHNLEVLYFFNDNKFIKATFTFDEVYKNNQFVTYKGFKLNEGTWIEGTYVKEDKKYNLIAKNKLQEFNKINESLDNISISPKQRWQSLPLEKYTEYIMMYSDCRNRLILNANKRSISSINEHGWGAGVVYKNFESDAFQVL